MRTTIQDIHESGYIFRVTAPRESIVGLADELLDEIRAEAMGNMQRAQDLVVSEVKKTLGREAAKPARPNEPPRQITGELGRSWKRGRRSWRKKKTELRGAIESKHPAAAPLEFGAFRSMGIRPHPYYRPSLARVADEVGAIMTGTADSPIGSAAVPVGSGMSEEQRRVGRFLERAAERATTRRALGQSIARRAKGGP